MGKTALAHHLALRIAGSYPDGQMYVTMGTAGDPRPPRDILHSLLRELQWPEEDMRGKEAAELGGVFRAKTADKRMLIVLDGARTPEQVMAVLPGGSQCSVITTSRANLRA
ncbi:MAG: SARP family transcriptional regulator, partial [Thermoplasmata archaeon]|nr:SARP family transcriptional regulator [Thermoplasmata archaeon]